MRKTFNFTEAYRDYSDKLITPAEKFSKRHKIKYERVIELTALVEYEVDQSHFRSKRRKNQRHTMEP